MISAMVAAFIVYCCILLSIGIYFYRTSNNQSSFSLGNRSLNYWLTAIAAQASDMSDWLFMGFPGLIFSIGFSGAWFAFGLCLFMFLSWHYLAPALRKQTEEYQAETLSSFLAYKVKDSSGMIQYISGFFCLFFFTFYIAAGIVGIGKAFTIIFDIPYHYGIIIGLIISLSYTLLGGLLAVTWSNVLQGLFLLACIMIVPLVALFTQFDTINAFHQGLLLQGSDFNSWIPQTGFWAIFISLLKWGPGYFGQPHILINFMSIKKTEDLSYAKFIGCSWQILALLSATAVGIIGKVMFFNSLPNRELVFIVMVKQLFNPFLAGFILCSVLAATVSTINIQSLISASLIAQDIYQPLTGKKATLLFTRIAIMLIPTLSLIIARNEQSNILDLVLFAWSGLAVTFGPSVLLTLYYKKITRTGICAGLLSGGLTAILWPINGMVPTMIIGYCTNTIITLLVSSMTADR